MAESIETLILQHIPANGSTIGNGRLLDTLRALLPTLTEQDYWTARDALIDRGVLGKGRGRGGAVYLIGADPASVKALPAKAPAPAAQQADLWSYSDIATSADHDDNIGISISNASPQARITDQIERLILKILPDDGATLGNGTVLERIKSLEPRITDDDYWATRNALIDRGVLGKGRGRGGAIYLVGAKPAADPINRIRDKEPEICLKKPDPHVKDSVDFNCTDNTTQKVGAIASYYSRSIISEKHVVTSISDHFDKLSEFESGLWKIADDLRANSGLASNEYFMPILGLIFLRHATNRFYEARDAIEADKVSRTMIDRPVVAADFQRRRALMLPEGARYDALLQLPKDGNLGAALTAAMEAIEEASPPLKGQLPRDFERFEGDLLERMMRAFDTEGLRSASGDVFGRIYEYFLAEFSKQGAHDNGEFFTPPSIVQTIVNIIEPDHGIILDPACGSGGMFVQSSHFIEDAGQDTMKRVTFYGHEKNETTARLAQINLAVHGLQGTIRSGNEAITYYKDPHELAGKCDFVMANPPFNVDEVDSEKVKDKRRLPFGLPGVNKQKKVSNANYLWLQYFYSYLNENGRAGVVMSSQASSAGRDEATVRQKLVETGAVDVMIDIRGNFFYTRTVPCQLWFFDRAKERDETRGDHVLMLDARNIFRKVSRAIYDFSPEQQKNIAAIVWLYRGQQDRFLKLVESYLARAVMAGEAVQPALNSYEEALGNLITLMEPFVAIEREGDALSEPWQELAGAQATVSADIESFAAEAAVQTKEWPAAKRDNTGLHAARTNLDPLAERCRDLTRQIDLAVKLAGRVFEISAKSLAAHNSDAWNNAEVNRARKALDEARANAVETLRRPRYFVKQADWLQERFPDAVLRDVEGLVKLVNRATIAAHDWSLTPGRYVGVAPEEVDENFDFDEKLRDIHIDLRGLNDEAVELAARIARNFEELGA